MTIQVEDVSKAFAGKNVLSHFNLEIASDTCYAVVGEKGSGKTTLCRLLLGLERPDSGRIRLLGDYKYAGVNAGAVFEEDRLFENMTAVKNAAIISKRLSEKIAAEELSKLLPKEKLAVPVSELAEAERRLVCIVRATLVPSDVLVFDEPLTGLTKEQRKSALSYVLSVKGTTPLVITSETYEGLSFAKRVDIHQGIALQQV